MTMIKTPTTIQERLKAIRAELKLSQREFAKQMYVSQSQYAELETGKRNFNDRMIHLISVQFNVNKKYLKNATGEMFNTDPPDSRLNELLNIFDSLDEFLQDYLLVQAREILKIQKTGVTKK